MLLEIMISNAKVLMVCGTDVSKRMLKTAVKLSE
jgi:hypothetical protein